MRSVLISNGIFIDQKKQNLNEREREREKETPQQNEMFFIFYFPILFDTHFCSPLVVSIFFLILNFISLRFFFPLKLVRIVLFGSVSLFAFIYIYI